MLITYKGEPSNSEGVPPLTELMGLDKKDEVLPAIYFFHGHQKQISRYNEPLEEYELSPDMLLMWSRLSLLATEIPALEDYLD